MSEAPSLSADDSPATLLSRLQNAISADAPNGGRWLVAVSGGADSVALLRLCHHLQHLPATTSPAAAGPGFHVAHFDHRLRPDSAADAAWVAHLCQQLGLPLTLGAADPPPAAGDGDTVPEERARQLRYDFLIRAARDADCSAVLTAHTADDQAETVLHHILRGTGLAGLRGIPAARELAPGLRLIRPLLGESRAGLRAYLAEIGQGFRDDPTNASTDYTRNRLRHEVLPALAALGFDHVPDHLNRLARQSREAHAALAWMADRLIDAALLECTPERCRLDLQQLQGLPDHLARELFVRLWTRQNWPRQRMGFADWERAASLLTTNRRDQFAAGVEGRRRGGVLEFHRGPATPPSR